MKKRKNKRDLKAKLTRLRKKLGIKGSNESHIKLHKLEHEYINL